MSSTCPPGKSLRFDLLGKTALAPLTALVAAKLASGYLFTQSTENSAQSISLTRRASSSRRG